MDQTHVRARSRFRGAIIATVAFVALLVVGLAWIAVTYGSDAAFPVPGIGNYNLVVGAGLAVLSAPVALLALILWIVGGTRPRQR